MFKLNDKKHRKRALMKLQCAPNKCASTDDKDDDFYNISNDQEQKVTNKALECVAQYNLEDAPSHLVRKTMKFEEIHHHSGIDEIDNVESISRATKTFSSVKRSSKVAYLHIFKEY